MAKAFFALLLVCLQLTARSDKFLHGRVGDDPDDGKIALDKAVMQRGIEELAIAAGANKQAAISAKDAKAAQENLLSEQAVTKTEESYLKLRPMVPEAKAQLLEVRKLEALAKLHAKHAAQVLFGSRYIPEAAAEKAVEATKGWIKSDAAVSAEASSKVDNRGDRLAAAEKAVEATKGWIKSDAAASAEASSKVDNRGDRLAAAVAAAAEPYHLALLRNQKFCEETYAKAKSATSSSVKLQTNAKEVALKAQGLQAAGEGLEAQQTFGMASGMMNEAELLRQWGQKLYGQANTACGSGGGYEMLEQQAAANTVATMVMNAPAKLPPA